MSLMVEAGTRLMSGALEYITSPLALKLSAECARTSGVILERTRVIRSTIRPAMPVLISILCHIQSESERAAAPALLLSGCPYRPVQADRMLGTFLPATGATLANFNLARASALAREQCSA